MWPIGMPSWPWRPKRRPCDQPLCYDAEMARHESDREDLLREATALVERIELTNQHGTPRAIETVDAADAAAISHDQSAANLVIGFRANGAASFFFGADPVYHFNTAGELRRAYGDGVLYKAVRRQLVALRRVRQPHEVQLQCCELSPGELAAFVDCLQRRLHDLASDLHAGKLQTVGQVPATTDVLSRVRTWLAHHRATNIAARPNVVCATNG